jgi:hypothetical protein
LPWPWKRTRRAGPNSRRLTASPDRCGRCPSAEAFTLLVAVPEPTDRDDPPGPPDPPAARCARRLSRGDAASAARWLANSARATQAQQLAGSPDQQGLGFGQLPALAQIQQGRLGFGRLGLARPARQGYCVTRAESRAARRPERVRTRVNGGPAGYPSAGPSSIPPAAEPDTRIIQSVHGGMKSPACFGG